MSTNVKPVTWFEIGSADSAATQAFYGRLFGWTFAGDDDSGMDYTMISAGDGIKGGIFGTHGEIPSYAIFYVEVPDVATTCREADEAGGKVLVEPTSTPDGLVFAQVLDPFGNHFGLYSPPSAA
jgi:predicted enzyme related to lactoylglutathione lyase